MKIFATDKRGRRYVVDQGGYRFGIDFPTAVSSKQLYELLSYAYRRGIPFEQIKFLPGTRVHMQLKKHMILKKPLVSIRKQYGTPLLTPTFALLLIPKRNREHVIGDLEEEYRTTVLPQYGSKM